MISDINTITLRITKLRQHFTQNVIDGNHVEAMETLDKIMRLQDWRGKLYLSQFFNLDGMVKAMKKVQSECKALTNAINKLNPKKQKYAVRLLKISR